MSPHDVISWGLNLTEAYVTKKVKEHLTILRKLNGTCFDFQKISDSFTSGIPDYYITCLGRTLWLELKAPGERPRPLQIHTLKRLEKAGNTAEWTDNVVDAIECINQFVSKSGGKTP